MATSVIESKLAALVQLRDWTTSSLGHPSSWPPALRTLAKQLLNSEFPMFLAWGPQLGIIYNEPYQIFLGDKHPDAMGARFRDVWAEIWDDIASLVAQALSGVPSFREDLPLVIHRNGRQELHWFTFSYSPVFDDDDKVAGMMCAVVDTSNRVLTERRQAFLLRLADNLHDLEHPQDVMAAATRLVGEHFAAGRVGYADVWESTGTASVERDWTDGKMSSLAGEFRPLNSFGPNIINELRAGRTLRVDDIQSDPRTLPYAAGYASIGTRATLTVPLRDANGLTAMLFVHEEQPRHWSDEDVMLLQDVANRTWDAVKRARVEERLREESHLLELLHEAGRTMASTLDMQKLLQAITDHATLLSGAKFGAFFYTTHDEQGDALLLYTLSGAPREAFDKFGHPRPTALFGPTFKGDGPIRIDDVTQDPRYGRMEPHHGMPQGHLPVRSYLAVPVVLRSGESAGGLFFGHPEAGIFTERTERMLVAIAAQAATAIDNARLYEAASQAAEERKQLLAREREARTEAERLSKAKDEFLAMLAHELRNPLAPISSAAELLELAELDEARIKSTSRIIVRQVKHMTGLINDLLDVSRVTRGLAVLSKDVVDLKRVIADAAEQAGPVIDNHGHSLSVKLAPGSVLVQGDHKRLVQVLANLLTNAAKYTPNGGQIEVAIDDDPNDAVICVRDNGIGMAPELLPSIFELFTQAERTSDRSQGGLGLGLALVKSLVQLHGGTVSAKSKGLGKGSVFTVRLPRLLSAQLPAGGTMATLQPKAAHKLRVLVVDDNADAASMLGQFLESAGHKVTVLHSSEAALHSAQSRTFDACLLDIGLAGMSGLELAKELRRLSTTKDALLIAVTGYGQPADQESGVRAGFDHYVVKPASPAMLASLLTKSRTAH